MCAYQQVMSQPTPQGECVLAAQVTWVQGEENNSNVKLLMWDTSGMWPVKPKRKLEKNNKNFYNKNKPQNTREKNHSMQSVVWNQE